MSTSGGSGGGGSWPDLSGAGSPVAAMIDPATTGVGKTYLDTTSGAVYLVVNAIGTPTWCLVGGEVNADVDAEGVVLGHGAALVGASLVGPQIVISDIDGYNGSGDGITWLGVAGGDGHQRVRIRLGAVGVPKDTFFNADGSVNIGSGTIGPDDLDWSAAGDAYFTNNGIILKSPDATLYRVVVSNIGVLTAVAV